VETVASLIEGIFGALAIVVAALFGGVRLVSGLGQIAALAVRQNFKWGLAVVLFPIVGPVLFAHSFPSGAKPPLRIYLSGVALLALSMAIFILRAYLSGFFMFFEL
jgi:hypothetical protein